MDRRDFLKVSGAAAVATAVPFSGRAAEPLDADQIEARVSEVLSELSLWEKVSLMSGRYTWNYQAEQKGYGSAAPFKAPGIPRLGIPDLRFIDGPRGINFEGSTAFPVAMARGATWDPELCGRVGDAMGYEARAGGANFWGGLCLNVLRHPAGGRAQETYGEDPHHLAVMGVATLGRVQKHVMACAKHYACNNNEDSRFYVNVKVDERTLREIYLPHFRACARAGVASFMSAYNFVNGKHCGAQTHLLREVLKGEWGYEGFVVSDFTMGVRSTVRSARAGLDIEMPGTIYYGRKLWAAASSGLVPREDIDDAVRRILRERLRFAHLEDAPGYDRSKVAGPEHAALARETAAKSMVLLKNEGSLLPLEPKGGSSIAVLGRLADVPNIGDRGSSSVRPPYVVTPLAGIRERLGTDRVIFEDGKDLEAAAAAARDADVTIIVAGLDHEDEGEGGAPTVPGDRDFLGLHKKEIELIRAVADHTDRLVVVLMGGSAITMPEWKDRARAILMIWYPGMEGGNALADVIFGDVNPAGRLPFMWPKDESQCAPFKNWATTLHYDMYHGYRLADRDGFEPEFPFGFGLSYTTFSYSNLALDREELGRDGKLSASLDVTNTGARPGEEVVQLYVGAKGSRVERVRKELKAFTKLSLEPGETRTVTLEVPAADLAFYDVEAGQWTVESGEYLVYVGPCADEKRLLTEAFRIA